MGKIIKTGRDLAKKAKEKFKQKSHENKTENKPTQQTTHKKEKPVDQLDVALSYLELLAVTEIPIARLLFDTFKKELKKHIDIIKKELSDDANANDITLNGSYLDKNLYKLAVEIGLKINYARNEHSNRKSRLTFILVAEKMFELFEKKFRNKVDEYYKKNPRSYREISTTSSSTCS